MTDLNHETILAYVGSYAEAAGPGLYACRFNRSQGTLELIDAVHGLQNPTFMAIDEQNKRLFTIYEEANEAGGKHGLAAAYDIDVATGKLQLLNKEHTVAAGTCHIALDRTHSALFVSSYHGGMVGLSPIGTDGKIAQTSDVQQHSGRSIHPDQTQSRAHSVTIDATNTFAIVCDLGADRIYIYKLDLDHNKMIFHHEIVAEPGAGPRHFTFDPSDTYGYVINELNATVTVYAFDREAGTLSPIQTISTLPASYEGDNACADIHMSPDGKFLYGSNRGHDSIVVYRINEADGTLTLVEHVSTQGNHPRNFAVSPDGQFVLVANRDTNNIVTFKRDPDSGTLTATGEQLTVSRPVCIKFFTP